MTKFYPFLRTLIVVCFTFALASVAHAQATRTWVSGVGDDANPCSRTAPCKTFAGAISKTFINGEIDAMDFGGFGAVTITKSITIDGGAAFASVLASGVNGIIVNVGVNGNDPQRRVTLRRLSINGTGSSGSVGTNTGLRAINVIAANIVYVENCFIQNFSQEGINFALAETAATLFLKDTNIQNCNVGVNVTTTTGFVVANLNDVKIDKMVTNGLVIGAHGHAHVRQSYIAFCGTDGVSLAAAVTDGTVNLESTFIASNGTGVRNGGTGSVIDLSNTSILQNNTGIASSSGAAGGGVNSHGNNVISGNTAPGTTPNPVGQQ
jgi:hypothetical protein